MGDVGSIGVGMIDFQWTGVGKPSTDIAYFLAASASGLLLDRDMESLDGENGDDPVDGVGVGVGELRCLRYYHNPYSFVSYFIHSFYLFIPPLFLSFISLSLFICLSLCVLFNAMVWQRVETREHCARRGQDCCSVDPM